MSEIKHVAIIMDGNGRWAQTRSRPRFWGHVRGAYRVSDIVERSDDLGLEALTLYAFSTENWSRPKDEIKVLLKLLYKYLTTEFERIVQNNIVFKVIGDISVLDEDTIQLINTLEGKTINNNGLKLTFCFNYSGREEITNAFNSILKEKLETNNKEEIDFEEISKKMLRPEIGDVDLLIRTGGDQRISNFLLWQIAYAELFFTDVKWPDFSAEYFEEIVLNVMKRERRFGSISEESVVNFEDARLRSFETLASLSNPQV